MKRKKLKTVDVLIGEYLTCARSVNEANFRLIQSKSGFRNRKIKLSIEKALIEYENFIAVLEELEPSFIGDLENYYHTDIAHLGIKQVNQDAAARARTVFLDSLQRFNSTICTKGESINFNQTTNLARLSILIAALSFVISFGYSILVT
ncbi:conserved hypothetical protein [Vibrio parahaemolyticus]|uniref:hypothetical protein n=1 Tax=Vibrio parahaemolyticus TaxID=670 RepID=UPI00320EBFE9